MNLSLFEKPTATLNTPSIELRPYQREACERIDETLSRVRSALLVMATGTGKTTVFSEAIKRRPGRTLVLAHRDELIRQAAARIRRQTGREVQVEKAEEYAERRAEVVVGSVQTLQNEMRLSRWNPDHFSLLVVDEAHHAVADSYRRILGHFADAKVLGVTATPDRADEAAMGTVFDDVAYVYEIADAIADGWLCPIRAVQVQCDAIDLSAVKTVAGDLNAGELDDVMATETVLHQVAKPTLELAAGRRTLVFTTSVANAHRLAEVFNRYRPDCARAVDGATEAGERRRTLGDHQAGRYQFLVNVGVLTEGYDDPLIACVAMARPTKSRALYAQCAGRGTRTAPGKTDLLLLDFVGNSGRHALVSSVDILAGKHPDEVLARAKKAVAEQPGMDISAALRDALAEIKAEEERQRRKEEIRRRAKGQAAVAYRTSVVDPFAILGVRNPSEHGAGRFGDAVASDAQLACLAKMKVPLPEGITKRGASRLIGEAIRRREAGLCTFAQCKTLQRYGHETKAMAFQAAGALITALAGNGWKPLPSERVAELMGKPDAGAYG